MGFVEDVEAMEIDELRNFKVNQFLRSCSDSDEFDTGHGKALPYLGWFWRDTPIYGPYRPSIGHCGDFIGIMENNKWGYNERQMTEEELIQFKVLINELHSAKDRGIVLKKIWDWFQGLPLEFLRPDWGE